MDEDRAFYHFRQHRKPLATGAILAQVPPVCIPWFTSTLRSIQCRGDLARRQLPDAIRPGAHSMVVGIQAYCGSAFGGAVYCLDNLQSAQSVRARDGRRTPLPDRTDEVYEE